MKKSWLLAFAFMVVGCGSKGDAGPAGAVGATGPGGPAGPMGPPGTAVFPDAGNACTTPCHTFNGVVEQWRFSNHSHPQENEIPSGVCGNCHGLDGIQQRLANNYTVAGDAGPATEVAKGHINYLTSTGSASEIGYGGATVIGKIHCSTCHDFNQNNDPHVQGKYVPGSAAIRVPGGVNDEVVLERSPDKNAVAGTKFKVGKGNLCVMCHKSRKDVTWYINPTTNVMSSYRWGPHEGPQSDIYLGKGGYEYANKTYSSSTHSTITNGCVDCHMGPVAENANTPDHTMQPKVAFCVTCHKQYKGKNFDVDGGQAEVRGALFELQALLNGKGLLTRGETSPYPALDNLQLADALFYLDKVRPGSGTNGANQTLDGPTAGAVYNYLIIARGSALGVHNPTYTKQLLWDSIVQIKGSNPSSLQSRPN